MYIHQKSLLHGNAGDAECFISKNRKIEKAGGEFFMELPEYPGVDAETKFKDVNGVVFDVSEHNWRL